MMLAIWSIFLFCFCTDGSKSLLSAEKSFKKKCEGVQTEALEKVLARTEELARSDVPKARLVVQIRDWVRDEKLVIREECSGLIVQAVIAQKEKEAQQRENDARPEVIKKNQEVWDKLTIPEKRYVLWRRENPNTKVLCETQLGALGRLDRPIQVISVISPTQVIVGFLCGMMGEQQGSAMLSNIDTKAMVSEKWFDPPAGVYWCSKTITYATAIGGTRTVYLIERISTNPDLESIKPPASAKLSDFDSASP